jgi:uncharacterized membrane protein YkvA (DUF1232 family)
MVTGFCDERMSQPKPPARFEEFQQRAQQLMSEPSRVKSLVARANKKLVRASSGRLSDMVDQLRLVIALIRAWLAGDYRQVSNKTVGILMAALLYFVVPFDVIPDFLFGWGLLDDAAVLGYVFSQLHSEIEAFKVWQEQDKVGGHAAE